ncbi:hypothetical protein GCM10008942_24550 [Rhizomicrobium electricum]|uniref:Uncharacterized protein n=1 Tax=Rhizomicrobium electricum TaxID=480070 RepID=A0ABP3PVI5_9PROT
MPRDMGADHRFGIGAEQRQRERVFEQERRGVENLMRRAHKSDAECRLRSFLFEHDTSRAGVLHPIAIGTRRRNTYL